MTNLILIVDDDHLMQTQLRELLEAAEYRVVQASNAQAALTTYAQLQPDLVLLDAIMPGMDGFACCQQLQRLPGGDRTPVLMITALYDEASVERAFAAGATDFITKPIHWPILRQRVRRLLAASQVMQTLREQTEQAQMQEMQLRMALEAAQMGTWKWDILTNKVSFSENLKTLFGLEAATTENSYETFLSYVHLEDRDRVHNSLHKAIQTGAECELEFRVVLPDNSIRWLVNKGVVFRDTSGKAVQMLGVDMDITKRKHSEENLHQSEERFQILARATNDVVWDWNLVTHQLWWNNNVHTLYGYLPQQVSPDPAWWHERIHPEDRARILADIRNLIQSGQHFWSNEYRFRRADGSYTYIFDRAYAVRDSMGKPVRMIGAMMDISDRKRTQEELERQNMRSRLFADVTLKIRQSLQIDEILQTSVTEVQKLLQADRVLIFKMLSDGSGTVVKEEVVPGFPVTLGQNIIDPCFNEGYIEKYRKGRVGTINNTQEDKVEPCYAEFLEKIAVKANLVVPILQHTKLWGLLIAHQCAHPRDWNESETELLLQLANQIGIALAQAKLLEQETRQRQELARSNDELQEFAFVASHDLQEPLRKIKTFGDRLKLIASDSLSAQALDYLERMQNATRRMQTLIEDLLTLSRVTTRAQPFVPVNLFQITQEVLSDLEITIQQEQAKVEVGELPILKADPLQMRQLLQNLIINALKFHSPEEPPVVKIYSQILPTPLDPIAIGTEQCQIIVEDNGIGFDEKYLDRIFNVFQRLHGRSEYEGTGIGLAICRKIVERHQGSITAESIRGQGAKFIVTLPMNPSF
ncbi:PAS domain-containing protein [Chlorogloeopsis sp. ULAP02]|uniref:PAS domain-containing protein n=1 Tax=Chlorogloeopsis sp. ULAP02 TaxID=3107926 RepID=UPI0031365F02